MLFLDHLVRVYHHPHQLIVEYSNCRIKQYLFSAAVRDIKHLSFWVRMATDRVGWIGSEKQRSVQIVRWILTHIEWIVHLLSWRMEKVGFYLLLPFKNIFFWGKKKESQTFLRRHVSKDNSLLVSGPREQNISGFDSDEKQRGELLDAAFANEYIFAPWVIFVSWPHHPQGTECLHRVMFISGTSLAWAETLANIRQVSVTHVTSHLMYVNKPLTANCVHLKLWKVKIYFKRAGKFFHFISFQNFSFL